MSDDDLIPMRLQRILNRIARSIDQTEKLSIPVAVRPDEWTIQIFQAIESGRHHFSEIQLELGTARNILTDRLTIMMKLGILTRVNSRTQPNRYEYFINSDDEDGPSGQPAMVLV
jgi:DNA-binding HxlR family transcriptional regulator